jgi:hypothetical protein
MVQGGHESSTEGLGELPREEWLAMEEDGSQVIQCKT